MVQCVVYMQARSERSIIISDRGGGACYCEGSAVVVCETSFNNGRINICHVGVMYKYEIFASFVIHIILMGLSELVQCPYISFYTSVSFCWFSTDPDLCCLP